MVNIHHTLEKHQLLEKTNIHVLSDHNFDRKLFISLSFGNFDKICLT